LSEERGPAREYATDEVVVEWWPSLCFHSQNCIRALPQVFDPAQRPWVKADAASADAVEAAVATCPSGALRSRRFSRQSIETEPVTDLRVAKNGPLLVSGGVRVYDDRGTLVYEGDRAALCRCGGSGNKPFCDGSHKTNGFDG
jgi:uncharacterized Fe-S cluster protein YjdI